MFRPLAILLALLLPAAALTQGEWEGRDEAFRLAAHARVAAQNKEAADLYTEAAEALEEGNLFFAKLAFNMVLEDAPHADDAMRGLARVEHLWENNTEAESWARRALELRDATENRAQLAYVLLAQGDEGRAREALDLVRRAARDAPGELWPNYTLFLAAHRLSETVVLREASARMVELAPEFGPAHFFHGQFLAEDGDRDGAERELLLASELGVNENEIALAMLNIEIKDHLEVRRQYHGLVWFGLLGALLVGALLLTLTIWFRRRLPG